MEAFVTSEIKNNIAEITFGTPKSNALPSKILELLTKSILSEAQKPEVKLILLKSYGENAFCAGASFDELLEIDHLEASKKFFSGFANVLNAIRTCGKLVVVRVQGKATGGGVGLACAADYCFAVKNADLALPEINLEIGPFVIGPFVERKIGKAQFIAMSLDTKFRNSDWALQHNIYQNVSDNIEDMDQEISNFLEKLCLKSSDVLADLKKIAWEGTEHFETILPQRILLSAQLVLKESAKKNIEKIKQQLKEKNK